MTAQASTTAPCDRYSVQRTAQVIFERDVDAFLRGMVDDDGLAW